MEAAMNRLSEYQQRIFQRNLKVIQALQEGTPKTEVTRRFRLSRRSIYYIWSHFHDGGVSALIPENKAPKTKPEYDALIIQLILSIRDQSGYGAQKIHDELQTHRGKYQLDNIPLPSARSIHHILRANHRISVSRKSSLRRKRTPDHYQLRDTQKPGMTLEADMKTDHYLQKRPLIINGIIDICSKVASTRTGSSQGTLDATLTLIDHVYEYGIPQIVKTDNDMVYIGQVKGTSFGLYTRLCLYLGIEQVVVPIRKPRWKPFIERFFRTWDEDFFTRQSFPDWDCFDESHLHYMNKYNTQRPHQGLKEALCNTGTLVIPNQFHQQYAVLRKPAIAKDELIRQLQKKSFPLLRGQLTFIRRLPNTAIIDFKGNQFHLPEKYQGKMIKGTIHIEPNQDANKVDFYFKDQKIKTGEYRYKAYKIKEL
jgi:hypothetical protein